MKQNITMLCLGDSYTIGEGVPLFESFPYLLNQLLREKNIYVTAPEIVAKTGFTSFELIDQINKTTLLPRYDYVTLLIGVNNQYRTLEISDFENDLEFLIKFSIEKANTNSNRVIVLSIPDWGVTPFAKESNPEQITIAINAFNKVVELLSEKYQTKFINITDDTRKASNDNSLLAPDLLHYSKTEHLIWAKKVVEFMLSSESSLIDH